MQHREKLSSYKVVEATILCFYAAMEVAHELLPPLHIKHKKIEHMLWLVVKSLQNLGPSLLLSLVK